MPIEKNFLLDPLLVNYDSDGISSSPIASHLDTESEKQFSDSCSPNKYKDKIFRKSGVGCSGSKSAIKNDATFHCEPTAVTSKEKSRLSSSSIAFSSSCVSPEKNVKRPIFRQLDCRPYGMCGPLNVVALFKFCCLVCVSVPHEFAIALYMGAFM